MAKKLSQFDSIGRAESTAYVPIITNTEHGLRNKKISLKDLSSSMSISDNISNFVLSENINKNTVVQLLEDGSVEGVKNNIPYYEYVINKVREEYTTIEQAEMSLDINPFDNHKFIIAYSSNVGGNYYGTIVEGEITETGLVLGYDYVFSHDTTFGIIAKYDIFNQGNVILSYTNTNFEYAAIKLGVISGGAFTFSDEFIVKNEFLTSLSLEFDILVQNKFIVSYSSSVDANGYIIVGEISGMNVSLGEQNVFAGGYPEAMLLKFDPFNQNKFIILFGNDSGYKTLRVGEISGLTTTLSLEYPINCPLGGTSILAFDPFNQNKFVISYQSVNNYCGSVMVGEVVEDILLGNVLNFGYEYSFSSIPIAEVVFEFDPFNQNKFAVGYVNADEGVALGNMMTGEISGTVVSFSSEYLFSGTIDGVAEISLHYDPFNEDNFIVGYFKYSKELEYTAIKRVIMSEGEPLFGEECIILDRYVNMKLLRYNPQIQNEIIAVYLDTINNPLDIIAINKLNIASNTNYNSNIDKDSLLGVLLESGLQGNQKPVMLFGGFSKNEYGLDPNTFVYVSPWGRLTTEPGDNNVQIGLTHGTEILETTSMIINRIMTGIEYIMRNTFNLIITTDGGNTYNFNVMSPTPTPNKPK